MLSFLFRRTAAIQNYGEKPQARRIKAALLHRSRALGVGLEVLEHRALLSATTIEIEPNDKAATATIAQFDPSDSAAQLAGNIATRKDRDFFQFTAPSSGSVNLTLAGTSGLVPKVEVENSQRAEVFQTEPHDGINSGSFAVEAGQSYTLRIESKDKTIGAYTVDLVLSDTAPPANGGADEQNEDGPNDQNHDAGDDHNQRHGGHGADDVVAAIATSASTRRGADDPANHDAGDDRLTVALATRAVTVDDHGVDRQNDHDNQVNDVKHEDRQADRRNDRRIV
jgi:hypothetical protein